jgi:membrane dipeptidase
LNPHGLMEASMDRNARFSRRDFLAISGSAAIAALLPLPEAPARTVAPGSAPADAAAPKAPALQVSARAARLYADAFVVDANTLASIGYTVAGGDPASRLRAIAGSGLTAFKTTLGGSGADFEQTVADIAAAQALIEAHPERFIKITGAADLDRAARDGKTGVILSFEAASMLDGTLDRIDLFRQFDVLVMQLTYNRATPFGHGCLDGDSAGVTEPGREAIARMNALGVALDLSHANAQTTADGIRLSARPPLVTHAGCRAVFDHPRNKTDRDMRALADKGGVMGIYMLPFLAEETRQPGLSDYLDHMVHALDICGEDHVGIGTDSMFFTVTGEDLAQIAAVEAQRRAAGLGAPGENRPPYLPDANTPRKLEFVADGLLKRGYGERIVEKVLGLNFRRAFGEIWSV